MVWVIAAWIDFVEEFTCTGDRCISSLSLNIFTGSVSGCSYILGVIFSSFRGHTQIPSFIRFSLSAPSPCLHHSATTISLPLFPIPLPPKPNSFVPSLPSPPLPPWWPVTWQENQIDSLIFAQRRGRPLERPFCLCRVGGDGEREAS